MSILSIDLLVGLAPDKTRCTQVADEVAVHRWPDGSPQRSACFCGATTKDADEDLALTHERVRSVST